MKFLTNGAPLGKVIKAFRFGIAKLKALEELERMVHKRRAIERNKGEATRIYRAGTKAIDNAADYQALGQVKQEYIQKLMSFPTITSAGIVNRLEAFVDMIYRRERKQVCV